MNRPLLTVKDVSDFVERLKGRLHIGELTCLAELQKPDKTKVSKLMSCFDDYKHLDNIMLDRKNAFYFVSIFKLTKDQYGIVLSHNTTPKNNDDINTAHIAVYTAMKY